MKLKYSNFFFFFFFETGSPLAERRLKILSRETKFFPSFHEHPTKLRRRNLDATVNIDAESRLDPPAWPYKRPFLRPLQPGWAKQPETRLNGLKKVR